jgi:hypothetical protein
MPYRSFLDPELYNSNRAITENDDLEGVCSLRSGDKFSVDISVDVIVMFSRVLLQNVTPIASQKWMNPCLTLVSSHIPFYKLPTF